MDITWKETLSLHGTNYFYKGYFRNTQKTKIQYIYVLQYECCGYDGPNDYVKSLIDISCYNETVKDGQSHYTMFKVL